MEKYIICIGVALLILMLVTLVRVIRGPSTIDRLVGVNVIGTKSTILIIIMGTLLGRVEMYVDIALAYALLNFIASLAAARFFQRHREESVVDAPQRQEGPSC
ncbi:MAG: monovalent cation/H+ antiporter complex subunit F [Desulfobulbaceae bacterium]|nr:monovalent cation/H+ antiporter complex subunit F [Desulfobulbaceae bacterium]